MKIHDIIRIPALEHGQEKTVKL